MQRAQGAVSLGVGVGLRRPHWDTLFEHVTEVDFVEVLVDNWLETGGASSRVLTRVADTFPVVLHGVGLSIGGPAPLDLDYVDQVANLARSTRARWYSDHVCFSNAHGVEYHDLIPLPFTRSAVDRVVERARAVAARLPVPFALENASYYVRFPEADYDEAGFLTAILEGADCGLLLDVNNVWVNSQNHGYDPVAFLDALPLERVVQVHLAGHDDHGDVIIDTHGARMRAEVLDLYAALVELIGPVTTLVEWDNDLPPFETLVDECRRVRERLRHA